MNLFHQSSPNLFGRCSGVLRVFISVLPAFFSPFSVHYALAESPTDAEYSYQFQHQSTARSGGLPGIGGGARGGIAEDEEITRTEVSPALAPEEITARDNIRNVLRLVDGDTVTVGKEIQVKLIGVKFPEFEDGKRNQIYEQFAQRSKKWIEDFIRDPESALESYEGMNSRVNYKDKNGLGFVFYYLYFPDSVLEDIRKHELRRYDKIIKKTVEGRVETDKDRSDAAKADIKHRSAPAQPPVVPMERPESVSQYVISEAKYYHDDGSLKREEIFRDSILMIKRTYDRQGKLMEETFHDPKAHLYSDTKPKAQS